MEDRILGLHCGADDYLVKPYDVGELVARVETVYRRRRSASRANSGVADVVEVDEVRLDLARHAVTVAGREVIGGDGAGRSRGSTGDQRRAHRHPAPVRRPARRHGALLLAGPTTGGRFGVGGYADTASLLAEIRRYDEVYRIAVELVGRDGQSLAVSRPRLYLGDSDRVRVALAGRGSEPYRC